LVGEGSGRKCLKRWPRLSVSLFPGHYPPFFGVYSDFGRATHQTKSISTQVLNTCGADSFLFAMHTKKTIARIPHQCWFLKKILLFMYSNQHHYT
jgi:hypothetical protein